MSAREWEPGSVALVDSWRGVKQIAFRTKRGDVDEWCVLDGTDTRGLDLAGVIAVHPALVIDPEDREQVERLAAGYEQDSDPGEVAIDQMQAALRELANPKPPRMDEPSLWGVVEAHVPGIPRRRWVHHEEGRWVSDEGVVRPWDLLEEPELIREGVPS